MSDQPTTRVRHDPSRERYELVEGDEVIGWLDYAIDDGIVGILHTVTDPRHGGRGHGTRLVVEVLERLRDEGRQVLPLCSFVPIVMRRRPDLARLVPADRRARFDLGDL